MKNGIREIILFSPNTRKFVSISLKANQKLENVPQSWKRLNKHQIPPDSEEVRLSDTQVRLVDYS